MPIEKLMTIDEVLRLMCISNKDAPESYENAIQIMTDYKDKIDSMLTELVNNERYHVMVNMLKDNFVEQITSAGFHRFDALCAGHISSHILQGFLMAYCIFRTKDEDIEKIMEQ